MLPTAKTLSCIGEHSLLKSRDAAVCDGHLSRVDCAEDRYRGDVCQERSWPGSCHNGARIMGLDGCCAEDCRDACAPKVITACICTAAGRATRIGELRPADETVWRVSATAVPSRSTRTGPATAAMTSGRPRGRRPAWAPRRQARARSQQRARTASEGLCQRPQRGCAPGSTRIRNRVEARMIFYGGLHPGVDNGRRALVVFLGFWGGETELELGRSMIAADLVRC